MDNNTPYAPCVQSEAEQAWMHRGQGRPTDASELEAAKEYVPPMVYDAIEVEIRKAQVHGGLGYSVADVWNVVGFGRA